MRKFGRDKEIKRKIRIRLGGKIMRVISVALGEQGIAGIEETGKFRQRFEFKGPARPNVRQLYEDCFYDVPKNECDTFDKRF